MSIEESDVSTLTSSNFMSKQQGCAQGSSGKNLVSETGNKTVKIFTEKNLKSNLNP